MLRAVKWHTLYSQNLVKSSQGKLPQNISHDRSLTSSWYTMYQKNHSCTLICNKLQKHLTSYNNHVELLKQSKGRHIHDAINMFLLALYYYKTNRFHAVMHLFSIWSQKTTNYSSTICVIHSATFFSFVLPTFWCHLWSITEQTHCNLGSVC